jgi:5,6-dimethylbenzimidazole synthase
MPTPPRFDDAFRTQLRNLLIWRRDVRRFRPEPLPPGTLERLIDLACLAPSVGFSQPWRFIIVDNAARRRAVYENFRRCNEEAKAGYRDEKARLYAGLKLEGLREAPLQLAVFADRATKVGGGLGRQSMPETIEYSVVSAIHTMWLVSCAEGLGMGWISILDPERLARDLDVPHGWTFVAYLCLGRPLDRHAVPELAREGWEQRLPNTAVLLRR